MEQAHYNLEVHYRSFSLGRYFGVELRLHALTLLLLPGIVFFAYAFGSEAFRGFLLWLLLVIAVLVRESSRILALQAAGVRVTSLVLLPTGSVARADDAHEALSQSMERLLALVGPLSNFAVGLTMALLMYAATPHINLFERPWFSPAHLLRAAIWAQILLGGLNLLPALPLDAGLLLRRQLRRIRGAAAGSRAAAGISQSMALLLVLLGAFASNGWLVIMGIIIVLTSRAEVQTALATSTAEKITMGEVMLREYAVVSASDTLEDALRSTVPSLQEVFPVVRGPLLVGSVSRDTLISALRRDRNSYVQSVMTRTVDPVAAGDLLLPTLRRVQGRGGPQLLPVVAEDQVVGVISPGHLSQAMASLGRTRRLLGSNG